MTPQERAAAIAEQIVKALDVHPSPINIDAVLPWVKETRRAALLEAVTKIRQRGDEYMRDCEAKDASGKKYRDTYEMRRVNSGRAWAFKDLADELDRLAQEG